MLSAKSKLIKKLISYYLIDRGYIMEDLAKRMEISTSTLYFRISHPDTFKLWELEKMCKIMKLDDETKVKLLT